MNTGHPTHPLFKSMRKGWKDSQGSVRVLTTPKLMGILATQSGEQAQDGLPSPRPRQELFSSCLASVAGRFGSLEFLFDEAARLAGHG